jgi:hypothetical protein
MRNCKSAFFQAASGQVARDAWRLPVHGRHGVRVRSPRCGYPLGNVFKTPYDLRLRHACLGPTAAAAAPATPGGDADGPRRAWPPPSPSMASRPQQSIQPQPQLQPEASNSAQAKRGRPRLRLVPSSPGAPVDRQLPEDNPSLDDIILDEQYYKEMGFTAEEGREALLQLDATEVDPEGENLQLPGLAALSTAKGLWDGGSGPSGRWPNSQEQQRGGFMRSSQLTRGSSDDEADDEDADDTVPGEEEGQRQSPLLSPFSLETEPDEAEEEVYGPEVRQWLRCGRRGRDGSNPYRSKAHERTAHSCATGRLHLG